MRSRFQIYIFVVIFLLCLFLPNSSADTELLLPDPGATISMDLQNAGLKDILKIFSIQSGLNFIASEGVQDRTITLYLDKVPIKEAMDKLFKANNLSFELDKGSNIIIVKDWGKPQTETITKVFYLKHATVSSSSLKEEEKNGLASSSSSSTPGSGGGGGSTGGKWKQEEDSGITSIVKKLLSESGTLVEDYRTNSLIVTDTPSHMSIISQTIAALDVPVAQVMLEVEILDVNKDATDAIGLKYSQSPLTLNFAMQGAAWGSKFPLGSLFGSKDARMGSTGPAAGNMDNGFFSVNHGTGQSSTYQIVLDFLKTQSDTKFLARPKLLTLNNETAEISILSNEAIGIISTTASSGGSSGSTTASAERAETGVSLRVTPQINLETGEITMFVVPTVSEATLGGTFTNIGTGFSTTFKDPETRTTKSMVRVKDGETIVLGGLIRTQKSETITKLPVLGDIPIIGAFFRHKNKDKDKERELLVFITPRIVKDKTIDLAQAKKIVLPDREQNTASGYDRQAAISSSLTNFERKQR